ncbi:hypothetical protein VNO77_15106 [Canavalia gladiata]|uniref:Uncharacterized protein n=1 Tax=Canavalia gladiata TaxID=3824 RepID=A0AAN9M3P0_CANGL
MLAEFTQFWRDLLAIAVGRGFCTLSGTGVRRDTESVFSVRSLQEIHKGRILVAVFESLRPDNQLRWYAKRKDTSPVSALEFVVRTLGSQVWSGTGLIKNTSALLITTFNHPLEALHKPASIPNPLADHRPGKESPGSARIGTGLLPGSKSRKLGACMQYW